MVKPGNERQAFGYPRYGYTEVPDGIHELENRRPVRAEIDRVPEGR